MAKTRLSYSAAGVDIDAGEEAATRIAKDIRRTHSARVMERPGAFAGLFRLDHDARRFSQNYRRPVLVSCTDGVGTKVKLAAELGVTRPLGQDLVAMNVNDLIVQGAEPLFFLDYLGVHRLDPEHAAELVRGIADACQAAGCSLLGGETAEMPDLYAHGDFEMVGFAVGVCELGRLVDGARIRPGDVVLGLASNGVHANGFTLVRSLLDRVGLHPDRVYEDADPDRPLGEALLTPTRLYARPVTELLRSYRVKRVVTGMAHITGGGLAANLQRVLPASVDARIDPTAWEVPPIFRFLQHHGNIEEAEMERVFNLGIGYCLVVRPAFADSVARQLERKGETVHRIGEIVSGSGRATLVR